MPLANAFVRPDDLGTTECEFPLDVIRCTTCELVQLSLVVRPELLFRDYVYASSASLPLLEHFDQLAAEIVGRFAEPVSRVIELGSNDGVLLAALARRGVRVTGIEPAENLARVANARGLETWNEFFTSAVAERLVREGDRPAAVVGTNVLAHIADLTDVVRALDVLLAEDGVFVAEVPYLMDLLDRVEYDTIYHEHLSYFHLAPLRSLFARAGFDLFDVRRLSLHGGSIRIYVGRAGRRSHTRRLEDLIRAEQAAGLGSLEPYSTFAQRVVLSRDRLREFLDRESDTGNHVAGYGATAKGNTLLNYCGIGTDLLSYIADTTPYKQGLLTPGTHIPVRPETALEQEPPDRLLLLAWNYADAIVARHGDFLARGGRFIHPIPLARYLPA